LSAALSPGRHWIVRLSGRHGAFTFEPRLDRRKSPCGSSHQPTRLSVREHNRNGADGARLWVVRDSQIQRRSSFGLDQRDIDRRRPGLRESPYLDGRSEWRLVPTNRRADLDAHALSYFRRSVLGQFAWDGLAISDAAEFEPDERRRCRLRLARLVGESAESP